MAERICPSCGSAIPDGSQFCAKCGVRLSDDASEKEQAAEAFAASPEVPAPPVPPVIEDNAPAGDTALSAAAAFEEKESPWSETISSTEEPFDRTYGMPAAAAPAQVVPAVDPARVKADKANVPMSSVGTALSIILMNIPVIGLIIAIVWACGGCRKTGRRNLARAFLMLLILCFVLLIVAALLLRFVFADELVAFFEQMVPGYTLVWK